MSIQQNGVGHQPPVPPRIYLASSIRTYATPRYDRMLDACRQHFADCEVVPARGLYSSSSDWRTRWPRESAGYAELVFFADDGGCIGRGVYRELRDVEALGRPVSFLDDSGELHPLSAVRVEPRDGGSDARRYARVSLIAAPAQAADHPALSAVFAAEARALGKRGHRATAGLVKREAQLEREARRRERAGALCCERCGGWPVLRYAPLTSFTPHLMLCLPCVDEHERSTGVPLRRMSGSAR